MQRRSLEAEQGARQQEADGAGPAQRYQQEKAERARQSPARERATEETKALLNGKVIQPRRPWVTA
jgi:hypothetical protein